MTASIAYKGKVPKKPTEKDSKRKFEGQCFYCKKTGHRRFECTKFKNEKAKGESKKPAADSKNSRTKHTEKKDDDTEDTVFFAQAHIAEANIAEDDLWLADSGASYHMAHNKSLFENMKKADMSHIKLGDKSCVQVIGKGDVRLEALVDGKWKPCRLTNVLCVPDLRTNLFSQCTWL